jgi:hypothetical protein
MHLKMLERLADWLARKMNSTGTPLALASRHLAKREHRSMPHDCMLCGAAKAIVDCEGAIREEEAFNFVEGVRKSREALALEKRKLEDKVMAFRSLHEEKEKRVRPACQVVIAQAGQRLVGSPVAANQEAQDNLQSILARFPKIYAAWDSLGRKLLRAEISLSKRLASPSLAERKGRWPRDYIETKVNCYLIQHSWTSEDIVSILFPDAKSVASKVRSIEDQVRRAEKSGRPPLVFGWPSEEKLKEANRLVAVVACANEGAHDVPGANRGSP